MPLGSLAMHLQTRFAALNNDYNLIAPHERFHESAPCATAIGMLSLPERAGEPDDCGGTRCYEEHNVCVREALADAVTDRDIPSSARGVIEVEKNCSGEGELPHEYLPYGALLLLVASGGAP